MRKLEEMRQKVTPEEIAHTKKVLKEQRAKKKEEQQDKVVEPYI
jgi:hypothetical protein